MQQATCKQDYISLPPQELAELAHTMEEMAQEIQEKISQVEFGKKTKWKLFSTVSVKESCSLIEI